MKYYFWMLICTLCMASSIVLCVAVVMIQGSAPVVFSDDDGHLTYKPVARYQYDEERIRCFLDYVLTRFLSNTMGRQSLDLLIPFVKKSLIFTQKTKNLRLYHSEVSYKERDYFLIKDVHAFEAPKVSSYLMPLIVRSEKVMLTDNNYSAGTLGYAKIFTTAEVSPGYVIVYLQETFSTLENPWGLFVYNISFPNNQKGVDTWEKSLPISEFTFRNFGKLPKSQKEAIFGIKEDTVSTNPTSSWQ